MKNLSIIVISYNTKNTTKKCIESIIESLKHNLKIKTEIIVIDNGSKDGSVEMLQNIKYQISKIRNTYQKSNITFKIIKNKENLGYAKANNLGAKQAEGEYFLFLNSDIEVIGDAIPQVYKFFKRERKLFNFLGGKLLNKDLTSQPSCGPFYTLPVVFSALFLKGDYWGLTRWSPNRIKKVDWVSGACFITKKNYFQKVGGFDENIFMYMEEIDLFYRAKKLGLTVGFYPQAKFIHLGSASSHNRSQPIIQVYRGLLYFYKKHFSSIEIKILKSMLKLKAKIAILIGRILKNQYLIKTYDQALEIVENFR